jgi:simple sugar transport system permease protein
MKKKSIGDNPALVSILASIISIVVGLVLGFILLLVLNPSKAGVGITAMLTTGVSSLDQFGKVLYQAVPLMLCGLSVGFAFKTGLFNIGASGQYTIGAFCALLGAIQFQLPWLLCLILAMIGGGIWGIFPGLFKSKFNVNEVITSIMFNWIAMFLVNLLLANMPKMLASAWGASNSDRTAALAKANPSAIIPKAGLNKLFGNSSWINISVFIAILVAIIIWFILQKTTFGYELKACGMNKEASKYAGINANRNIVFSMIIAGALAGIGAGLYYLSTVAEWNPQVSTALPALGFNGISAALLACSNPIGTIFSSLFISYITVGGTKLSTQYYTKEIADVITALIIYLCAFSLLFKNKIRQLLAGKARHINVGKGGDN